MEGLQSKILSPLVRVAAKLQAAACGRFQVKFKRESLRLQSRTFPSLVFHKFLLRTFGDVSSNSAAGLLVDIDLRRTQRRGIALQCWSPWVRLVAVTMQESPCFKRASRISRR